MIFLRLFFIVFLILIISIKNELYYLIIIPILWIFAYKEFFKLNKKVLISIFVFNSAVTIGYIVMAYIKNFSPWSYLLYINLKVYTSTFFVMLFFSRVNFVKFFEFSKELSYILTLTLSMVNSYIKTLKEFQIAIKSRGGVEDRNFLKKVTLFFFEKANIDAKERALALKARGFFDD